MFAVVKAGPSWAYVLGEQQKVKTRQKSPTRRKVPHPQAMYIIFTNAVLEGVRIREIRNTNV
jgi:hypothetical protein